MPSALRRDGPSKHRRVLPILNALCALWLSVAVLGMDDGVRIYVREKHVSLGIPADWTYDRNVSQSSVLFDLLLLGPPNGGQLAPMIALNSVSWIGAISDEALYRAQLVQVDGIRSGAGVVSFSFVSSPSNITIDGHLANRCTFSYQLDMRREVISGLVLADDVWNLTYVLAFIDDLSDWPTDASVCEAVFATLDVESRDNHTSPQSLVIPIAVCVATSAIVAGVLVFRRKKSVRLPRVPDNTTSRPAFVGPAVLDSSEADSRDDRTKTNKEVGHHPERIDRDH